MRALTRLLVLALAAPSAHSLQEQAAAVDAGIRVSDEQRERITEACRAALDTLSESPDLPGASAALVLPDGTEIAVTVGYASREDDRLMEPTDRLLAGSIGKTYVTAAAHHLAIAGKLELDTPAVHYFEGEDWFLRIPNASTVTIRQLLRHESGIPRYVFDPTFWETVMAEQDKVWKPRELLAYIAGAEPLFEPGTGWAYADTNYIIVGMILERITEQSVYEYEREQLLEPNDLVDTVPSDKRRIPRLAQGYVVAGKQMGVPDLMLEDGVMVFNPQFEWCGGGYATTPLDLARWAQLLYSGEAFDGPYLDTMLDAVPARPLGPGRSYGLGVIVTETDEGTLLGHDGFMPGYVSAMGYFPDSGIAAAFQMNTDNGRAAGKPLHRWLAELAGIARRELAE